MKNVGYFAIALWFVFCLYWTNLIYHWTEPSIKPGQVWIQIFGGDDPFREKYYDTLKILDVKGDYVQYYRIKKCEFHDKVDTLLESDRKYWIYDLAKLQK